MNLAVVLGTAGRHTSVIVHKFENKISVKSSFETGLELKSTCLKYYQYKESGCSTKSMS